MRSERRTINCRFSPAHDENVPPPRRSATAAQNHCASATTTSFVPAVLRLGASTTSLPPASPYPSASLERVQVAVRRRPPFSREAVQLSSLRMTPPAGRELALVEVDDVTSATGRVVREFHFDAVFDCEAKQKAVYAEMGRPIVASALGGVNGCILAYGQTGTGKTYTMGLLGTLSGALGTSAAPRLSSKAGVVPRALFDVFNKVQSDRASGAAEWTVSLSLSQLYNDLVLDLFSPKWTEAQRTGDAANERRQRAADRKQQQQQHGGAGRRGGGRGRPRRRTGEHRNDPARHATEWNMRRGQGASSSSHKWSSAATTAAQKSAPAPLRIHEDEEGWFYARGQLEYEVLDLKEAAELLDWGLANRRISATSLNLTSSRSHTMITLRLSRTDRRGGGRVESKLLLVDLAGSERLQSSALRPRATESRLQRARDARAHEARAINKSLSALGNVVACLARNGRAQDEFKTHVPYRDSKLTRLLALALGGDAKTALLLTIGPSHRFAGETSSTLQFGSRCMDVQCCVREAEPVKYDYRAAAAALAPPPMKTWAGPNGTRLPPSQRRAAAPQQRQQQPRSTPPAVRAPSPPPPPAVAAVAAPRARTPAAAAELRRLQAELVRSERAQSETSAAVVELQSKFDTLSRHVAHFAVAERVTTSAAAEAESDAEAAAVALAEAEADGLRCRAERAERALRRVARALAAVTSSERGGGGALRTLCDQLESDTAAVLLDAIGACAEREADAVRTRLQMERLANAAPRGMMPRIQGGGTGGGEVREEDPRSPPRGLLVRSPVQVRAVDESVAPARRAPSPLRRRSPRGLPPPPPPHLNRRPAASAQREAETATVGTTDSDERIERIVETRLVAGGAVSQYLVHWANSRSADDEWFDRESLMVTRGHAALVLAFEQRR